MSFEDMLARLNPFGLSRYEMVWALLTWLVIIGSLLMMFTQRRPNLIIQILLVATILISITDRVGTIGQNILLANFILDTELVIIGMMRIAMFVLPLACVGLTKSPKSRIWGLVATFGGIMYFVLSGLLVLGFFGPVEMRTA